MSANWPAFFAVEIPAVTALAYGARAYAREAFKNAREQEGQYQQRNLQQAQFKEKPEVGPSKFSEKYAHEQGFTSQAEMRGEDW